MRKMNMRMCGGDCLPSGMTGSALSGKPEPERRPGLSREALSGKTQLLVSRAGILLKREKAGKLSQEGEKVASELGKLLGEHGKELEGIGVVKDGQKAEAYEAVLMSRAELLSMKDGGCSWGC